MNALTVLNITSSSGKMVFAYTVAVFIIPMFAFYMIYRFKRKYEGWKKKIDPMKEFSDIDIAMYAVEVRNLPIDEGVDQL